MNPARVWQTVSIASALAASLACGSSDSIPDVAEEPPAAPTEDDARFAVDGVDGWYLIDNLIGNEQTGGGNQIELRVTAPPTTRAVDAWVPSRGGVRLETDTSGQFLATLDIAHLGVGEHTLLLAADGSDVAFAAVRFHRSHPLYIVVSTDWDDADNPALSYQLQEQLHADHSELVITHLAAPYTFTDPSVTSDRRAEIADWLVAMRDDYGDEIGLHIHPYCNFVEASGLTCKSEPSTVYAAGDSTGYTVMVAAYTREEFITQLRKADELFADAGLGKPTSFRAGGWTADVNTLAALTDVGYVVDTSALNWRRMEEWNGVQNGVLYDWNSTQWSEIDDTSQPYYPGELDIQANSATPIGILEVPDNGIMVDYVSAAEMIEIFAKNWDGTALDAPRQVSVGYHPPNFGNALHARIDDFLTHADQFLAADGTGPVVYIGLSDTVAVWPSPASVNP